MADSASSDRFATRWAPPLWVDRIAGLAWRLVVVLIALTMVVGLILGLSSIVLPIVLGLLFAGMLHPIADALRRIGAKGSLAALGAIAVLVAFVATVAYVSIRAIADQWGEISRDLRSGVQTLIDTAADMGIERPVAEQTAADATEWTSTIQEALVSGAISLLPVIASLIATLLLSVFVAFFFLKDGPVMWRWIVSRVSGDSDVFDDIGQGVWKTVSSFMLGQTCIAAIDAVFISLGALLLGVPNASAILMLTFLGAFVPYIGAFITGLVAVLLALGDGGLSTGLAMLAVVLAVQVIEGNVLQPWIQGKAVRLHPLVVALAVVAGGALAGFLGILLAVPVCAAAVVTMGELRQAGLIGTPRGDRASEVVPDVEVRP
jgi:predicted PurR-regulated permease PerM